jgi:uncharacterized glyoxalase superfamily protein PhnB
MLGNDEPSERPRWWGDPGAVCSFSGSSSDVDAVHAEAVRCGVELVHPLTDEPWGVRRFFVKDPNGVVLNVANHGGDAATP